MNLETHYDVIIVGAGPAGATCALQLRHTDLKVLLIDKATFPRSKTCGDAVVGRSIKTLTACCPELIDSFKQFSHKTRINHTRLYINRQKPFDIHWVNEAYCCRRVDFDNILINGVRQYASNVTFLENFTVDFIENTEGGITIGSQISHRFFTTKMLIGSDGTQSFVAKKLTNIKMSLTDHAGAVRTYFKGVKDLHINRTEVYILPEFAPGYLWVFPLSEDTANVGFGMLSSKISEKKANLKESLYNFIQASPILKSRFEDSIQEGKLEGFGLALGSRRVTMSGNHFLLTGDAASLIDPASGDGISNAIVSGKKAAEMSIKAHKNNNFSAIFLKSYDESVFKVIGKELRLSASMLRTTIKAPYLVDIVAYCMGIPFINRLAKKFI